MMKNTTVTGDLTEAKVIAALLESGCILLKPLSQSVRYDLLIEKENGQYVRVQCKTGRFRKGCIEFATASQGGYGYAKRKDYRGQADYFGVYCRHTDKCYLVPVEEVGISYGYLRVTPIAKHYKTRYAINYEIKRAG